MAGSDDLANSRFIVLQCADSLQIFTGDGSTALPVFPECDGMTWIEACVGEYPMLAEMRDLIGEERKQDAYLAETTSASTSCFMLEQDSPSLAISPEPTLPICARASLTKGPRTMVMGKRTARTTSAMMERTAGTATPPEERDSRWWERMRCASSCARRMASSDVCSGVGTRCGGGDEGEDEGDGEGEREDRERKLPKTEDSQDDDDDDDDEGWGGVDDSDEHDLERMLSRKPE